MPIRIVTWNINSVRLRMPLLKKLVEQMKPDVICLQETKVDDPLFPHDAVKALGFEHIYFSGQKSYNGVAILSRLKLTNVSSETWLGSLDRRHISGVLPNGIEVHNFYVPAGGDIPDRIENPYYGFKLDFVEAMNEWFRKHRKPADKMVLVGDLNIAPGEHDVWSHKQLLKVVSHTPSELERMAGLYASVGWVDSARHFTPDDQKLYSWWSYRNKDWKISDRGRRLDHVWVTKPLKARLVASHTLRDARDWTQPSDHVPVAVDLAD